MALSVVVSCRGESSTPYRNKVNAPFATVASGPLQARIVDVPAGADRAAVRVAVASRVRAAHAAEGARALQSDVLCRFPPYRSAGGSAAIVTPMLDDVVLVRSAGRIVARTASTVRTAAVGGGTLNFSFEGWTEAEAAKLRAFAGFAYPAVRAVYGSPAGSGTIRVVKDTSVSARRDGGGYYNASLDEIHLYPTAEFPADAEAVNLAFLHLMVHAFHDDAMFRYDAWEEGFARAATIAALEVLDPAAEAPKPGGSIVRYTDYYLMQLYDALNQPALGNDRFAGTGWDGMALWRTAMATAAWLKVYTERRDFFARFNEAYYARFTAELAGNVPELVSIATGLLPEGVEGLGFADWYRRQHVLDTSVTPGPKLFVYNAPRFPDTDRPPSHYGWSQVAILHYYRTSATGAETPLSGTAFPIAWSWEYGNELPLEPQDRAVEIGSMQPGIGLVQPTFFNIGDPVAQRVTINYAIGGESVRTYLPVTFTGVEPQWNDLLGLVIGGDRGSVSVQSDGGSPTSLPLTQGGFGGRVSGGAMGSFSRRVLSYTEGEGPAARTVVRRINTGYDYSLAILTATDAAARRLTHTVPAGVRMLTVPATPFRSEPAADLGMPGAAVPLARWNSGLAAANKYEAFPLTPPFRPGRGFWVKLDADRTLQIDGNAADPKAPAALSLPAGWNQIGAPWATDLPLGAMRVKYRDREIVSLTTAIANGWVAPKIWRYVPGVGYQTATSLDAWDGVWIKVLVGNGVTLVVMPPTVLTTAMGAQSSELRAQSPEARALSARVARAGWRLRIQATAGAGEAEVTIGEARGATSGFDAAFDVERPPALAAEQAVAPISLRLMSAGGRVGSGVIDLDTDIRALGPALVRWSLVVRTARPFQQVTLSLSSEGQLPRTLTLWEPSLKRRSSLTGDRLVLTTGADGSARWEVVAAGNPRPLGKARPGW
jgi:hypothetical protein